jgi:hypothetical protein
MKVQRVASESSLIEDKVFSSVVQTEANCEALANVDVAELTQIQIETP